MPVIIEEVSAELDIEPQAESGKDEMTTEPLPQQVQQDALRRYLRQVEQRRTRLKAN